MRIWSGWREVFMPWDYLVCFGASSFQELSMHGQQVLTASNEVQVINVLGDGAKSRHHGFSYTPLTRYEQHWAGCVLGADAADVHCKICERVEGSVEMRWGSLPPIRGGLPTVHVHHERLGCQILQRCLRRLILIPSCKNPL